MLWCRQRCAHSCSASARSGGPSGRRKHVDRIEKYKRYQAAQIQPLSAALQLGSSKARERARTRLLLAARVSWAVQAENELSKSQKGERNSSSCRHGAGVAVNRRRVDSHAGAKGTVGRERFSTCVSCGIVRRVPHCRCCSSDPRAHHAPPAAAAASGLLQALAGRSALAVVESVSQTERGAREAGAAANVPGAQPTGLCRIARARPCLLYCITSAQLLLGVMVG